MKDYLSRAWLADALCPGTPTKWWEGARTHNMWAKYREARIVCDACPVTEDCLRDALQHEGEFAWFQAGHPPSTLHDLAKRQRTRDAGHAWFQPNGIPEPLRQELGIETRADLYDLVDWMRHRGYSLARIATYFGVSRRTTVRWTREMSTPQEGMAT